MQRFADVICPSEAELLVQSLKTFEVSEIGKPEWINCHEAVIRLSQQAVLEASASREENVKELFILHQKSLVLVHQAYCISIWKAKVLPKILEKDANPKASFLIYTVLFHEGAVVTLLEMILFHNCGCESLSDSAVDLIDYSAQQVTQLIGLSSIHHNDCSDDEEGSSSDFERQKRDMMYKIGLRCISLLCYLSQNVEALPVSASKRLVVVHDVPSLLGEILHLNPWQRKTEKGFEKFIDDKWTIVPQDDVTKVVKSEAQTWFTLYALLFNRSIMQHYEMNTARTRTMEKISGLLHDTLLDQLPILGELRKLLCSLTLSKGEGKANKNSAILLEEVPEIRTKIIDKAKRHGGFKKIAEEQTAIFLRNDMKHISALAKRLNEAYNCDFLAEMEEKSRSTAN